MTTPIYTLSLHDALPISKAEGDAEDAEIALFVLRGGGAVQTNLERQEKKFEIPAGTKPEDAIKIEKVKFGGKHARSEEHTSELQSRQYLVCRLLLEKKK